MQEKVLDQLNVSDNRAKFEQSSQSNLTKQPNLIKVEPEIQSKTQTKTQNFNKFLDNIDFSVSNHKLGVIKFKSFAALSLGFLCDLPYVGCILFVAAISFKGLATFSVKKASNSQTILFNFILYTTLMLLSVFLLNLSPNIFEINQYSNSTSEFLQYFATFCAGVIGLIFGSIYAYLYYKELSEITNQKYFLLACYCFVGAAILKFTAFGIIFLMAYLAFEIFAWIRVQKIQIAKNNYTLF